MKIYLDNAATTKTSPEVVEAMKPFFIEIYGNASSIHSFGESAKEALENAREKIAKIINADPDEIIFTSGGTESNNLAIKGVARALKSKGNHIITSAVEHHAVLHACQALEKEGFAVTYVGVDKDGFVKLDDLKKAIRKETILATIMHANNEIGTIQQIDKIGKICKEKNVLFHSDIVQSFAKVQIDVKKINIDIASISAHKFHGPKGIGALYIRKGTKLQRLFDGGAQELGIRPGTENVAGAVGFAKAAELVAQKDIEKMAKLRDRLISELLKIPGTRLNGSRENRLCNNANISFEYIEGEALLLSLDDKGIAVSTGSACTSHKLEPSHVLLSLGLKPEQSHGSIRFSLSKYTTEEEIDYTIKAVNEVVEKLRAMSPFKQKSEAHK